jgi:hypothetical protein
VFMNLNKDINMPDLTDTSNARYEPLIETFTDSKLIDGTPVANIPKSATGTIIAKQRGPNGDSPDQFYLAFKKFGDLEGATSDPGSEVPLSYIYPDNDPGNALPNGNYVTGIRTFEEINATMAELTTIPITDPSVQSVFLELQQQLPSGAELEGFLSSNQMGIAKLAFNYCAALVDDTTKRDQFFDSGTFEFTQPVATAFSTDAKKDIIVDALYDKMVIKDVASQPTKAELRTVLFGPSTGFVLFDELATNCANDADCTTDAERTRNIVKTMCVSVLSSAAVTVQ